MTMDALEQQRLQIQARADQNWAEARRNVAGLRRIAEGRIVKSDYRMIRAIAYMVLAELDSRDCDALRQEIAALGGNDGNDDTAASGEGGGNQG